MENLAENTNEFANVQEEELIVDNDIQEETQVEETQEETPVAADNSKEKEFSETKAYSERLNKEREKIKAEVSSEYSALLNAMKEIGFEGSPKEIAMRIKAEQEGVEYEDLKAREEAKEAEFKEMLENHEEVLEARRIKMEYQARTDLDNIKKAFPDVSVDRIDIDDEGHCNLGDKFMELMLTGKVDAVDAYKYQRMLDAEIEQNIPKGMGDVTSKNIDISNPIFKSEADFNKFIARNPDWLKSEKNQDYAFEQSIYWD